MNELISLISGFVGGEDAYSKGKSLMKSSKDAIVKNTLRTGKFVGASWKVGKGLATSAFNIAKGAGSSLLNLGDKTVGRGIRHLMHKNDTEKAQEYAKSKGWGDFDENGNFKYKKFYNEARTLREMAKEKKKQRHEKFEKIKDSVSNSWAGKAVRGVGNAASWVADKAGAVGNYVANSAFGQAVGGELKKVIPGLAISAGMVGEALGFKKFADDLKDSFKAGQKMYDSRAKKNEEGSLGEKKILNELKKLNTEGLHLSADALEAMGDFSGVYAKKLIGKDGDTTFAQTMGLKKGDGEAEIKAVDKVLGRLQNFADRISNSTGAVREQLIASAKKYATETDSDGNAQLQTALNEALEKFSNAGTSGKVTLDSGTIAAMTKASADAYKESAKVFEKSMDSLKTALEKENAKKSK